MPWQAMPSHGQPRLAAWQQNNLRPWMLLGDALGCPRGSQVRVKSKLGAKRGARGSQVGWIWEAKLGLSRGQVGAKMGQSWRQVGLPVRIFILGSVFKVHSSLEHEYILGSHSGPPGRGLQGSYRDEAILLFRLFFVQNEHRDCEAQVTSLDRPFDWRCGDGNGEKHP